MGAFNVCFTDQGLCPCREDPSGHSDFRGQPKPGLVRLEVVKSHLFHGLVAACLLAGACIPGQTRSAKPTPHPAASQVSSDELVERDLGFQVRDLTGTPVSMFAVGDQGTALLDGAGNPIELNLGPFKLLHAVRSCGKSGIWGTTLTHLLALGIDGSESGRYRFESRPTDMICVDGQIWIADSSGAIRLFDVRGSKREWSTHLQLTQAPIVALEEVFDGVYAIAQSGELFHIGFRIERGPDGHELNAPGDEIERLATGLRCPTHLDYSYG